MDLLGNGHYGAMGLRYIGAAPLNGAGAGLRLVNHNLLKGYQYVVLALLQGASMLRDLLRFVPLRR